MSLPLHDTQPIPEPGAEVPQRSLSIPVLFVLLGLILLFDVQMRYFLEAVQDPVLYRDEANDIFTVQQSWGELLGHFVTDWAPYVYLLALRGWMALFGDSELAVRSLSCAAILVGHVLVYLGAARWFKNRWPALGAVILLGCAPILLRFIVYYARPYALALLTCALAFERFTALYETPTRKRYIGFFLCALLLCNIQPVNLAFAAGLGVVWIRKRLGDTETQWGARWRSAVALPMLLVLAALPTLIQALRFREAQGGVGPGWEGLQVASLIGSPLHTLNQAVPFTFYALNFATDDHIARAPATLLTAVPVELVIVLAALTIGGLCFLFDRLRQRKTPVLDTVLLFAVPCAVIAIGGLFTERLAHPVKSFSSLALGSVLLTGMVLSGSRTLLAAVVLATLFRAAIGLPYYAEAFDGKLSDARVAARFIGGQEEPGDLLVLANLSLSPSFLYYYGGESEQVHHPYDGPVYVWHATRLWRHVVEPERVERTVDTIQDAAEADRRVWFVAGGIDIDRIPVEQWERWYSPEAYRAMLEILGAEFDSVRVRNFNTTADPFYVTLYDPKEEGKESAEPAPEDEKE